MTSPSGNETEAELPQRRLPSERQRAALVDLVRCDALVAEVLRDLGGDVRHTLPGSHWSAAEHVLHVVLGMELCARRFSPLAIDPEQLGAATDGLLAAGRRRLMLGTFRIARGIASHPSLLPGVILPARDLGLRSRSARDRLVALIAMADDPRRAVLPIVGAATFAEAARFQLVHLRHHLRVIRHGLAPR